MAGAQRYGQTVQPGTWTLLCAMAGGNKTYLGISATGSASAKFRSYVASSYLGAADPTSAQFRHSYTTSIQDRSALVCDRSELIPAGQSVFLEVLHFAQDATGTPIPAVFDATILGG